MKTLSAIALCTGLVLAGGPALAAPLSVELTAAPTNPASPQMGDNLSFNTVIRNTGTKPVEGVIAWISLVQVDKGKEQPVDLEDWSAHKAVTEHALAPGAAITTQWPMRLIQSGHYRVVVSAVTRDGAELTPSAFADFAVRPKAVVESSRVIPIAAGMPLLLGAFLLVSFRRRRGQARKQAA